MQEPTESGTVVRVLFSDGVALVAERVPSNAPRRWAVTGDDRLDTWEDLTTTADDVQILWTPSRGAIDPPPRLEGPGYGVLELRDPFEEAVWRLVKLNRRKRADYALDTDPWSNFRETARRAGMNSPVDAVLFNIHQKIVRLEALQANGRSPQNEAVEDTYDDGAVYFIIAGILARESTKAAAARNLSADEDD